MAAGDCETPSRTAFRSAEASDLEALLGIYRESIVHLGASRYTPAQVRAWSGFFRDPAEFGEWLARTATLVAVDDTGRPLGFGGLEDNGRIASLFVAPAAMRRGIGSALLARLLEQARTRGMETVTTEASEFARPLFEKFGFEVTGIEHTEVRGVAFTRNAMRASL